MSLKIERSPIIIGKAANEIFNQILLNEQLSKIDFSKEIEIYKKIINK